MPPLQINTTNLPIGRGPRAPATTTVRQPDKSQITAANIIPGKRQSSSPIENIRQAESPIPSLRVVRQGMPTFTNLPIVVAGALAANIISGNRQASSPIENIRQAEFPIPSLRARRGMPPLQINTNLPIQRSPPRVRPPRINTTNLPIGRGPRAPTTTTVRKPDKSQITAANIISGKRRR